MAHGKARHCQPYKVVASHAEQTGLGDESGSVSQFDW